MRTFRQVPSCLAIAAAVIIISLPVLGGPSGWRERMSDPPTFLTALTLVGVAILLWSYREPETVQR